MILITKPRGIVRGTISLDIMTTLYTFDFNLLKPTDGAHLDD